MSDKRREGKRRREEEEEDEDRETREEIELLDEQIRLVMVSDTFASHWNVKAKECILAGRDRGHYAANCRV